jgi:hypothetical protein
MSMMVKSGACCRPIDDDSYRERCVEAAAAAARAVGVGQMRWRVVEDGRWTSQRLWANEFLTGSTTRCGAKKKIPAKTFPRVRDRELVRISPLFLSIIEVGLWGV